MDCGGKRGPFDIVQTWRFEYQPKGNNVSDDIDLTSFVKNRKNYNTNICSRASTIVDRKDSRVICAEDVGRVLRMGPKFDVKSRLHPQLPINNCILSTLIFD